MWVHNFHLCQVNNAKRLEIDLFYIWHICLGVGKLHNLPNKKCQTVGVALSHVGVRDWQGSDTKYRDVQITFCGIIKGEHDYI